MTIPAVEVVGEAGDGETALKLNHHLKPDVVLLDICLPGLSGFEVASRLKQTSPRVRIIVLSVHEKPPFPGRLMEAGASAYLTKGCPATELVDAIRTVARGGRHIGSTVAQHLVLGLIGGGRENPFEELSGREMEVMLMLAEGLKIREIASTMHLSPKTVATYKYRIFEKLSARNDVEVTRMAMRYGVVPAT